jgi:signal transduction histidine kinase/HAMP domain-containing protein/sensor domain CHASE-containing protein
VEDPKRLVVVQYRWATGALLGLLGLLLNAFPVQLTPGIDVLFGGVAYLLAAVALGPGPGLLAGATASLLTVWLWNHPWAWLIFSLEALAVGYLHHRWSRRPLTATALYWLLAGVPLVFLTYWGIMGMSGTTPTIIALKQPLNSLVNAVFVEALLLLPALRRVLRLPGAPRLRSTLAVVVLVASAVPALIFGVWAGRREWSRTLELATERVQFAANSYAAKLDQYVRLHRQTVRSLAQTIEGGPGIDAERLQRLLAAEHAQFPGFLNLYVANAQGRALAFQPLLGLAGESLVGVDFSDRDYFRRVRETRSTVVSEVFVGRGGTDRALVVIAHPIQNADTFAGYVLGALDLNAFPTPVLASERAERLRVIDSLGSVVYDTEQRHEPGAALRRVPDESTFKQMQHEPYRGVTLYQRESAVAAPAVVAAQVLVGYAALPALGWWVWVDYPFRDIESAVAVPYVRLLAILIGLVALSGVVSNALSGRLAAPLLRLRWTAAALAAGDRAARVQQLPAGTPHEIMELGHGFDEMADTLVERAAELEELGEITRSLGSTLDAHELLRQITDATERLLKADGCGMTLVSADGATLRATDYLLGLLAPVAGQAIPADNSLVGWVVRTGQPALVADAATELRMYRAGLDLARLGSVVCAPLTGRSGSLGALIAVRQRGHPRPFTRDDLQLLERLARTAAIAVENARLIGTAQEASRAKSDFIAAMSHELRTPLNAVLGHLQLLELEIHGQLNFRQKDALARIGSATRHLRNLIEEVLSFARLEAGRVEVRFEEVDLCELLREVAAVVEPLAWEKQLDFRLDGCGAPEVLWTDPDKVRQILINLAGNAVKFTEAGQIRLSLDRLSPAAADPHEPVVVVRVADTGPGISAADRERLFQPFEQLDSGLSRRHGGTGLGLFLSGQYAKLIGGRIEVESEHGRGSTFSLLLPARPREMGEAETMGGTARRGGAEPQQPLDLARS